MLAVIWMSPWNSYFKDREIAYLLREAIKRYWKAVVMVADVPASSTYFAMWYTISKSKEKARLQWNWLKNRTKRIINELWIEEDKVIIIDRATEIEPNQWYQQKYNEIKKLYNKNFNFQTIVNKTSQEVLENSGKMFNADSIVQATHYLLSEIAFMEFCPSFFWVDKVDYVYHKNRFVFEEYIAWKFDGLNKPYLDFILLESPYETIMSISDSQKTRYEIIKERWIIKCWFVPYLDKFTFYNNEYWGTFYNIIKTIADKNNLKLEFIEQVWYWVISQRLHNGYIDIFCSPIRPTKNRRLEMFFSKSLFQSNIYAYINQNSPYANQDLNTLRENSEIRIAVKENDIHHELALQYFPKARLVRVPQLSLIEEVLQFVLDNKADMTFRDETLVEQYLNIKNLSKDTIIKQSFDDKPIIVFDNCLALPRWEFELKKMIDECI